MSSSFAEQPNAKGVKVENKDGDAGTSVSTTQTTAANYDTRRDVAESRAEQRREVQGDRWSVAPQIGAATGGYGFGVGVRAGYTFRTPIYVGGNFMYHTSGDVPGGDRAFYPSAEVGYDVGIGPVLVRPYVGAGVLSRDAAGASGLLYPGVTVAYLIEGTPAFVGADGRVLVTTADGANDAVAISGTAGVNF